MLPALTTRKIDVRSAIATRGSSAHSSLRLRQSLIVGEVALTVVLLAASGLLIRTLIHFESLPPGFNPSGIMTAKASLDDARYHDPIAFQKLLTSSTAAMRKIPGVENAAVGLTLPYERALNDNLTISDGPNAGQQALTASVYTTPGYFETLQIPLLAGRTFTDSDTAASQPVAIVNQTFARKYLKSDNPVGRYLNKNMLIIGVVADVQAFPALESLDVPVGTEETVYTPASQLDQHALAIVHIWFQPSWIVRTSQPVTGLTSQMQRALASADPNLPFSGFYSMSDLLNRTLAMQRIEVALLSTMAGLALLLSAIGIFSLVANMVAQRTREIGIRIALGSSIRRAMLNVGSSGLLASSIGLLLGLALSALALRTMRSVLYGLGVYDPATLTAVILTLAIIILLAATLPTLRIATIDPAKTLRED
jgi:predicted permease